MLEFRLACAVGILRETFSKQVTELRKMTLSLIPTPPHPMGSTVADTFTHVYTCVSSNFSVPLGHSAGCTGIIRSSCVTQFHG